MESVDEEDADAMVLREQNDDSVVTYEVVDDEEELKIISKYFEELLEDVEIRLD